jgi:protein-tyrosine phosphatase
MLKNLFASPPAVRVLMVCMGNICRSPTAEGVLRAKLQQAGLDGRVQVDSAGTHGYHVGAPPDARAQEHAQRRGYDLSRQRARRLQPADLERFDLLLVMDGDNRAFVNEMLAGLPPAKVRARVHLLREFEQPRPAELDVPDPYYGGPAGFDIVLDQVESACTGLVGHLSELVRGEAAGTS